MTSFSGAVDTAAGTVSIWVDDPPAVPGLEALVEIPVVQDGRPGTGPENTVELVTERAATVAAGCGAVDGFEGDVRLRSFYANAVLTNAYIEITSVTPTGHDACNSSAPYDVLSAQFGLWGYGTIGRDGSGFNDAIRTWRFRLPDRTAFVFHGHVVADLVTADPNPPTTVASPGAGSYWTGTSVELRCTDAETGCAATYYTTDGTEPTRSSPVYGGPIPVTSSFTLRWFSVDHWGNTEAVRSASYVLDDVDDTPPVTTPSPTPGWYGTTPVAVTLSCADTESGCAATYYALGAGGPTRLYAGPITIYSNQRLCFHSVDRAGNSELPRCVSYSVDGGTAVWNATSKVPECATVASSCDTGTVLIYGRGTMSGWSEQNRPNTISASCSDGNSGTVGVDESLDQLRVSSVDGGPLRAGQPARIDAFVTTGAAYASDSLDLYYTTNVTTPSWTLIGTQKPTSLRLQTLSSTFTIPASATGRLAIRGQFRNGILSSACTYGTYNDRDDLIFAIAPALDAVAPSVSITSPASGATVDGVVAVSATASDATGVAGVELIAGGASVAVRAAPPYDFSWNTDAFQGRSVVLRAVAWDAAGNRGVSAPVTVNVGDGSCSPACATGTVCQAGTCVAPCTGTLMLPGLPVLAGARYDDFRSSTAADLNGDGHLDLAFANYNTGATVFLGNGDGTFGARSYYMGGYRPVDIAAGDVTRDGRLDLVVADSTGSRVVIFPGSGDGTFGSFAEGTTIDLTFTGSPVGVALADFNFDGRLDVAVAEDWDGIGVRRNGTTGFGAETRYAATGARSIAAVDLNGDGKPDLVAGAGRAAVVLLNNGTGGFLPASWYWGPEYWDSTIGVGDVDGDGDVDLVLAQSVSLSVLLNDGQGGFGSQPITLPNDQGFQDLNRATVADVDGDGVGDVVAASPSAEGAVVYRGLGGGTFGTAQVFRFGTPGHLLATDLNGDGHPDLVGAGGQFAGVALNEGGTFASFETRPLEVATVALATGDMDQDGLPDLVASGSDSYFPMNGVDVLLQGEGATFADPLHWDAGASRTTDVALADVDRDGDLDALVLDTTARTFVVLTNDGTGRVVPSASYSVKTGTTQPTPQRIAAGDLDGDGYPDVVVTNGTTDQVLVFPNDGLGGFGTPASLPSAVFPAGIALADMNGDGALDVVVADYSIKIYLNALDGTFTAPVTLSVGVSNAGAVAAADLNGDGLVDLATANSSASWTTVSVLLQTAPGRWAPAVERTLWGGSAFVAIRAVDLDRDGDLDVVIGASTTEGVLGFMRNDGAGTLAAPVFYSTGLGLDAFELLGVGSDGWNDVVTSYALSGNPLHVHHVSCGP